MSATTPDQAHLDALERRFDPEMRFRPLGRIAAVLVGALLLLLSLFHYYTAGFGLLQEITHRGVHMAFVLGLIFLVFPHRRALLEHALPAHWWRPGGVPWFDWPLAASVAAAALYIPWVFDDLAFASAIRARSMSCSAVCCSSRCSRRRGAAWAGRCR